MNKNLYYCSNMLILVCFYILLFVLEIANFPLDFKQLKQDLELSNVSHDWDHQKAEVSRSKVYSVLFKLITKASFTVSLIVRIDFEVLITNIFFFFHSCSSLPIFCCFRSLRFIIFKMHNCANKLLYCNYKVFIYRDRGLLKIAIFTFYIRRIRDASSLQVYNPLFILIYVQKA